MTPGPLQQKPGKLTATVRRTLWSVRSTVAKFRLIAPGAKVVVGVSGGADSLCLLHSLHYLNRRHNSNWRIIPVHVDPGFEGWSSARVSRVCTRIGLECLVRTTDVHSRIGLTGENPCYVCARERRKALFETCGELGATSLALGHHMEDVSETLLINLLMTASGSTFVPRQKLFDDKLTIIRPLYCVEKPRIVSYLKCFGIRAVRNRCPYVKSGTRLKVRRFLEALYRQDRHTRTNIFWGIHNLKPEYLPPPGSRQTDRQWQSNNPVQPSAAARSL